LGTAPESAAELAADFDDFATDPPNRNSTHSGLEGDAIDRVDGR
jgi:hypothetical protein